MTTSAESMAAQTAHYLDLLYAGAPDDAWLIVSWPDPDPAENGKKRPCCRRGTGCTSDAWCYAALPG